MKQIAIYLFAAILGVAFGRYCEHLFQTDPAHLVSTLIAVATAGLAIIVKCLFDIAVALEKQNSGKANSEASATARVTG